MALWNIFQLNLSINLCNLLSLPVQKETRIQTQVLPRKQRNCLPTAPRAIKLWIVVATLTNYLSDEKTHKVYNTKLFERLDHIKVQLYEVDLEMAEIDHREPIIVGFFIIQYARFRKLEFYHNFF